MMNNTYSNRNSKSPVWKASHPYTAPDPVRICLWRGLRTPAGIQHNPRPYRQQSEPDCKAYERHGQCLWSRCKRSKGADETGMAITKIHAIKATVHKAVDYICDPAKTDESILISSFGCSPETAAYDFKFALSKTSQADTNKAFHLIQSFMPSEVSYKEAHQIGVELADKLLEGKYSYIVSTHIDKGHVHNHIIFCAADNVNHEKYHDCKRAITTSGT